MLKAGRTVEEVEDFLGTGDDGKLAGLLGIGNGLSQVPTSLEGDLVKEAQGRDRDRDRAGRHLLAVGEEQLVVADLLGSQQRWRLAEVTGEQRHLLEVGVLCARRKMTHLHVLGHAETEWCHGKAPLRDRMEWAAGSESMVSQRELTGKRREPRMDGNEEI